MIINFQNMNYQMRDLIACEALLRRASEIHMPFALKGSLLTRQYFSNPEERSIEDIDFLYMNKIKEIDKAHKIFNEWMISVTELQLDDGVEFRSFSENSFWRRIDYAMADDFPTVNTDLAYIFTNEGRDKGDYDELSLDISFNLNFNSQLVPLNYKPIIGNQFLVPYTIPLSMQIAWKLHQTIVRPRFKDLYDLKHLLKHPSYDHSSLMETLSCLHEECKNDKAVKIDIVKKIFTDDLSFLFNDLKNDYYLRKYSNAINSQIYFGNFIIDLRNIMNSVGINKDGYLYFSSLI